MDIADFRRFDLILAMDRQNLRDLQATADEVLAAIREYYSGEKTLRVLWDMRQASLAALPSEAVREVGAEVLETFHGRTPIVPGITAHELGGHSDGVSVITVGEGAETAIFWADVVPTTHHVQPPYIMAYDIDVVRSFEVRSEWLARAAKEGWTGLFYHDAEHAFGLLARDGRRFVCQPVEGEPARPRPGRDQFPRILFGGLEQIALGNSIDQAGFEGPARADRLTADHQVQGRLHADETRRPLRPARPRQKPQQHLRQAELRIVLRDPVMAGHGGLEAAAEGRRTFAHARQADAAVLARLEILPLMLAKVAASSCACP